jgi:hypothetical protein
MQAKVNGLAAFQIKPFVKAARSLILSPAITDFIGQQWINCLAHYQRQIKRISIG